MFGTFHLMSAQHSKMAQNTEKNRGTNWTPEEKEYLFSILTPQLLAIIENKENDSNANKRKSAAWKSVYESFISKYGNRRTLQQVKGQWHRMKLNAKSEDLQYRNERKKTGGGPPPTPPSDLSQRIKESIPSEFAAIRNPYDCDAAISTRSFDDEVQEHAEDQTTR